MKILFITIATLLAITLNPAPEPPPLDFTGTGSYDLELTPEQADALYLEYLKQGGK